MIPLKTMIEQEFKFEVYDFKKTVVGNIPVHHKHFDFSPCIHMRILFHYGAKHDIAGKEGIAHFLEHMLFKGNNIYTTEKAINDFNKDFMLGSYNAYTSMFELVIEGKTLPHNFEKVIEGVFASIHSPTLTKEAWGQEMKVITQEAWRKFKNEKYIKYIKDSRKITHTDMPDRLRIYSALGWPDTIAKITHQDIIDAHKRFFIRENMEIFLAGNIDRVGFEKIKEILQSLIEKVPTGARSDIPYIPKKINQPLEHKTEYIYSEIGLTESKQASLSLQWIYARDDKKARTPNTESENKKIATGIVTARVISDIVFEKLRAEQSWCYSARANYGLTIDYWNFKIGVELDPKNINEAITITNTILEDIKNGNYTEKFEQRKRLLIEGKLASEHTTINIIENTVNDYMLSDTIVLDKYSLEELAKVSYQDMQHMIKEYLTLKYRLTEIIRPKKRFKLFGR